MDLIEASLGQWIETAGYAGLFLIVLAESGIAIGFFLPGGSLLFTAGLLASQGVFNIYILTAVLFCGAVIGDNIGYWFGKKIGPKIFSKKNSFFFNEENINKTKDFYSKHGPNAIIIGRFIPIIRTFVPIMAGVGQMDYVKFLKYNVLGGILWAVGLAILGYLSGSYIPGIEKYMLPIIAGIILLSLMPIFLKIIQRKKTDKND